MATKKKPAKNPELSEDGNCEITRGKKAAAAKIKELVTGAGKKAPVKKVKAEKALEPKPLGRPAMFSQALADTICERISDGESLRSICSEEIMPNKATVFRWLASDKEFSDQYARAKEEQAETLADEIIEIADDGRNDTYIDHESGVVKTDHDVIARSRLRVEARKWVAAKLKPKKYGDRTTIAGDAESPLAVLTMDQIAANPNSRLKVK